jgi:hypothetical protein
LSCGLCKNLAVNGSAFYGKALTTLTVARPQPFVLKTHAQKRYAFTKSLGISLNPSITEPTIGCASLRAKNRG